MVSESVTSSSVGTGKNSKACLTTSPFIDSASMVTSPPTVKSLEANRAVVEFTPISTPIAVATFPSLAMTADARVPIRSIVLADTFR